MSKLSHEGAKRLIHEGQLSSAEQLALSSHLQTCAVCRQHMGLDSLLRRYLVPEESSQRPSPQFTTDFLASAARRSQWRQIMKPIYTVGGLAALALIVLAGWTIFKPNLQATTLDAAPTGTDVAAFAEEAATQTAVTPPTEIPSTATPVPPTHASIPPTHTSVPATDTTESLTPSSVPTSTATSKPIHMETGSFEFEGLERQHIVFLPESYSASQKYPLVIDLHAIDFTAEHEMQYTELTQVAENQGFLVVNPSGVEEWNSGGGERVEIETPDVDDVGYISALIDKLSDDYSIDLERVYATGFSNGGFMAYKLACQLSDRIAAIASVAGVLSTNTMANCSPLRPVPVLHIHGTADRMVPILGGLGDHVGFESAHRTVTYWAAFNNCDETVTIELEDIDQTDGSVVEKTSYTNCDNNSDVIYFKVISGGHTWPGAGWSGYSLGETNQDINASVEIWDFFKAHQLTPTSAQSDE